MIIVLNASRNRNGNSTMLANQFLDGKTYQKINLVDYHIDQTGQTSDNDELKKVTNKIADADKLVITTPVYWSDMPGYLKTFIDRSGDPSSDKFNGIKCFLLIQGFQPQDAIKPITNVVKHWATRNGMQFIGSTNGNERLSLLQEKL